MTVSSYGNRSISTEEVLATLQKTKVSELQAICDALTTCLNNALSSAAKLLEPKA